MAHNMSMNQDLIQAINQTPFLSDGDKSYLISKLDQLNPLEKLKLKQSLQAGMAPPVLQQLQIMRAKFYQDEAPKKDDLLTRMAHSVIPQKAKRVLSKSILNQPQVLGGPVPQAITDEVVNQFNTLDEFTQLSQLRLLNAGHVTFDLNQNGEQLLQNFLFRLTKIFEQIPDVNLRRNYFMNFLQSPLFGAYLNTGLTALRHPELEPANIILNLLYQIDGNYLNNKQFSFAARVSTHIRSLCGI